LTVCIEQDTVKTQGWSENRKSIQVWETMGYSHTPCAYWRALSRENDARWRESFEAIAVKYGGPQDINVVPGSYCTVLCIKQMSLGVSLPFFFFRHIRSQIIINDRKRHSTEAI